MNQNPESDKDFLGEMLLSLPVQWTEEKADKNK